MCYGGILLYTCVVGLVVHGKVALCPCDFIHMMLKIGIILIDYIRVAIFLNEILVA